MNIQSHYDGATQPAEAIRVSLNTTEDITLEVAKEQLGEISMFGISSSTVFVDNELQVSLLRVLPDIKSLHASPNANLHFTYCLIEVVERVRVFENEHNESGILLSLD